MAKKPIKKSILQNFYVGVYDPLSAISVERSGFPGVWLSSYCVAASRGLPDMGLMTPTELGQITIDVLSAVQIPVLLDCESGFGGPHNLVRFIKYLLPYGIAGIVINNQTFPAQCSFYSMKDKPLETWEKYMDKIKATLEVTKDTPCVIIARLEDLFYGESSHNILKKVEELSEAGIDHFIIHGSKEHYSKIVEIIQNAPQESRFIAVPTRYSSVTFTRLREDGFHSIIIANHLLRKVIIAFEEILSTLKTVDSISSVEPSIASLSKVDDIIKKNFNS